MATAQIQALSEKDFLAQVTQLAAIRGWSWLHLRPGMTRDSWRTPISGPLGKGWPDLVLVRADDRAPAGKPRMIFAELKRDDGELTPAQRDVLDFLAHASGPRTLWTVQVWRPSDWPEIEQVLR
jgi:hypothetical protein